MYTICAYKRNVNEINIKFELAHEVALPPFTQPPFSSSVARIAAF